MTDTTIHIYSGTATSATNPTSEPPMDDLTRRRMLARLARGHSLTDGTARGGTRPPLRADIPPSKGDAQTAIIRLYDPIDSWGEYWGVSAKEFASVLDTLPETVSEIRLLVNSPGGECTEGFAIQNLLRNHPARTVAVIEGLAASAASYVVAACDEVLVCPNAEVMVHNPHGICMGEAVDMRQLADLLDHLANNMASTYAAKAGGTVEAWREVMAAETWYSAEEAIAAGLADALVEPPSGADDGKPTARFDLSIFNFAGRQQAPEPKYPTDRPAVGSSATTEGDPAVAFSDEQDTSLREKLGVDADADGDSILAAVDALLEQATAPPPTPAPAESQIPEGHVAVPEARLRDLEEGARMGTEAAEKLRARERTEFLDSVRAKYAPANRTAWETEYDRDPEGTRAHFATAPEILPVNPLGSGGVEDLDAEFADYVAIYGKET